MEKTRYPVPDRSDFTPDEYRHDPVMREGDLGATEGALADGRPYRLESWWWEGHTLITLFFSVLDLEKTSRPELLALIMPVLLAARVPEKHRKLAADTVRVIKDARGNGMYSLTLCVGEPEF